MPVPMASHGVLWVIHEIPVQSSVWVVIGPVRVRVQPLDCAIRVHSGHRSVKNVPSPSRMPRLDRGRNGRLPSRLVMS